MEFPRQEDCSGLPCPPPGDLPDPGDQTHVSYISCIGWGSFTISAIWEAPSEHKFEIHFLIQGIELAKGATNQKCMN